MKRRSVWVVEAQNEGQKHWAPSDTRFWMTRREAVEAARKELGEAIKNGWKKWQVRVVRYDASR